ncbi:MAG: ChaN family lipoprotein [Rhodocyclaceae bacterium]|nr:ChaN family lipoprotein [Rhodocyclaceae bacterium]
MLLVGHLALGLGAAAAATDDKEGAPAAASSCLGAAAWTRLDGAQPRPASGGGLLADMARRDVVLLGERHDVADDHRWQVQTLAALHAARPQMVIGFEMFPRRLQPVLDRWVAGELTARQFIEQSEWDTVWALPAELYLPLFEFARMNRIPMVALDVEQKFSQAIAEKGWDATAAAEREGVSRPAPATAAYRAFLRDIYRQHPALTNRDGVEAQPAAHDDAQRVDRGFGYFVESQTARDRAMAEALAHRSVPAAPGGKPLVVGIMGNGHVRFGWGVPHQLRALGVKNVGILMPLPVDTACADIRSGLADAVFALPRQAAAPVEPPRLGVSLEGGEDTVSIAEVMADSLAEKSGLKRGDRLLEVAGQPVKKVTQVIAAVRRQPGGTWLPLQVRRGGATLDLVVKFPARP